MRGCVFLRSFFGRIVSLLGLRRKTPPTADPSDHPETLRSGGGPRVCGTDATVSVSTVMFLVVGSAPLLEGRRLENEDFVEILGRAAFDSTTSFSALCLRSESLPLSAPFDILCLDARGVRWVSSSDMILNNFFSSLHASLASSIVKWTLSQRNDLRGRYIFDLRCPRMLTCWNRLLQEYLVG